LHTNYFSWEIINKKNEDKRHIEDNRHGLDWIGHTDRRQQAHWISTLKWMDGYGFLGVLVFPTQDSPKMIQALYFQSGIIQARIVF